MRLTSRPLRDAASSDSVTRHDHVAMGAEPTVARVKASTSSAEDLPPGPSRARILLVYPIDATSVSTPRRSGLGRKRIWSYAWPT